MSISAGRNPVVEELFKCFETRRGRHWFLQVDEKTFAEAVERSNFSLYSKREAIDRYKMIKWWYQMELCQAADEKARAREARRKEEEKQWLLKYVLSPILVIAIIGFVYAIVQKEISRRLAKPITTSCRVGS